MTWWLWLILLLAPIAVPGLLMVIVGLLLVMAAVIIGASLSNSEGERD